MKDAILSPRELTVVFESKRVDIKCLIVQTDRVTGNLLQPNAANGAYLRAKVPSEQILAESDALEYLCASI